MTKGHFNAMSEDELTSAIDLAIGDFSRLALDVGGDMPDASSESDLREAVHKLSDMLHSLRLEALARGAHGR